MSPDDLLSLPDDLPVPRDDGACRHLVGLPLPPISLPTTNGRVIVLRDAAADVAVFFCYPRTGQPNVGPDDDLRGWDAIPGARGCTPQNCTYRDRITEFTRFGVGVYGVSTQDCEYQQEASDRLRLPFPSLSDRKLEFASSLGLPTFEFEGQTLIRRLTLVVVRGVIETVFYPVFPPDEDAGVVLNWLGSRRAEPGAAPDRRGT